MRVAHVVPTYPPYRGGVGQLAAEYAGRLRARGHDVHVFTPQYAPVADDPNFVHRLRAPVHLGNAALTPSLLDCLRGFDLVHLHYPFFGGAEPVVAQKWRHPDQSLVLSYHMDAVASGVKGILFRLHARFLLPRVLAAADRVFVSSDDYASHSALAGIEGACARAEVHPYGVDTVRFHPGRESVLRERLGFSPYDVVVIFVSRLDAAHHFKGLPVLFDAFSKVSSSQWRLLVVGDGPLRRQFEGMATSKGISGRVCFAGDVSSDDLPAYYRASDVHVCPSTAGAEAFSLVTLEAGASGIPTLASALPGLRMVVVDGKTGVHVPPGDPETLGQALDSLLQAPEVLVTLGAEARTRVEATYGWDSAILRLERSYDETREDTARRARRRRRAHNRG